MDLVCILVLLFQLAFLLRIVMSFFPIGAASPVANARDLIVTITDPVVLPLRRALPPLPGGMAFFGIAELVILVLLFVITGVVCQP